MILKNKTYAVTHHLGAESPTAETKLKAKRSSKTKSKWLKITRKGLIVSALSRVGKRVRLSIVHSNYLSSAPRIFDIHPSIFLMHIFHDSEENFKSFSNPFKSLG